MAQQCLRCKRLHKPDYEDRMRDTEGGWVRRSLKQWRISGYEFCEDCKLKILPAHLISSEG